LRRRSYFRRCGRAIFVANRIYRKNSEREEDYRSWSGTFEESLDS
jgi:hypothetical protein